MHAREIPLAGASCPLSFFRRAGREPPLPPVVYHYGLACAAPGHSRLISSRIPRLAPSCRIRDHERRARARLYACANA